ncbi:Mitogen-activated protein kinase [Rhizophlyctis rosea]|uniref:mitogen-activated protein kinase n=1 Tax=Rhizophlyctis rosea TaxID=64517 RepID=A0AAD5SK04_9FUNG|nr:Mitogen-activated protein kinase [Rhizophlyctis rosea]
MPLLSAPITKKYTFVREIGKGAYGTVWWDTFNAGIAAGFDIDFSWCISFWSNREATDNDTGQPVAIKKVGSRNFTEQMLAKRALRELKLLRHLDGNDNITSFLDADTNDPNNFTELYLVEGLMEADLNQIIKSKQQLADQHYQYFVYQILRGLKWMHSANVIHRDLKPGNLLVNSDCELRICDFGLARGLTHEGAEFNNTEYVATRYYRAPEVVLSPKHYSKALDIWSVGCIFGELLLGKVMFKGSDYIDQLQRIFEIRGTPQDPTLMSLCSPKVLKYIQTWSRRPKIPLEKIFPDANPLGLDLLDKLLAFDPRERITAEEALLHPYLEAYHHPDDEPAHPELFDFSFESAKSIDEIKRLINAEVNDWKKRHARRPSGPMSPRYKGGSDNHQDIIKNIPDDVKRYEQTIANAPGSVEEELQMKDLKIVE